MKIYKIKAEKIKDSRKEETIEIIVYSNQGNYKASVPKGKSRGKNEVVDFPGKVEDSVEFVNKKLNEDGELKNLEINTFDDLEKVEKILKKYDNTKNWAKIGGNVVLALEYAILKTISGGEIWKVIDINSKDAPRPLGKCLGGGAHVNIEKKCDIQEFLIMSLNALSLKEAIDANERVYNLVKKELNNRKIKFIRDDEGGWAPSGLTNEEVLDLLIEVVKKVSDEFSFSINIGLDMAATQFYKNGKYNYKNKKLSRNEQIGYVVDLIDKYNLCYVEDPLEENDFEGFKEILDDVKEKCLVVGDDLICTNLKLLKKAIDKKCINGVIIKPNQIGSLIEVKKVIELAKKNNINCIISHRSGETTDTSISHLAVGFRIPIFKIGIYGKEREVKLKELRNIEKAIKKR